MKAFGRAVKGTYRIIRVKKYKERYLESGSKNRWSCKYCGNELMLWEIWHPNYGMLFDEYENIKNGKYSFLTIAGRVQVIEKEVVPFSPPPGSQLSLFPMPA